MSEMKFAVTSSSSKWLSLKIKGDPYPAIINNEIDLVV